MLSKLPEPVRPSNLNNSNARVYCACNSIGGFILLRNFSAAISVSPHVFFFNFSLDFLFQCFIICTYDLGTFRANQTKKCHRNKDRSKGGG